MDGYSQGCQGDSHQQEEGGCNSFVMKTNVDRQEVKVILKGWGKI